MNLTWKEALKDFEIYLRLEKSLSSNSIEAYLSDVAKLENYFASIKKIISPNEVSYV